jgi:hypothetical protein
MAAYPGAKTVDAELAKRTAVTLDTFVRKYGQEEGLKRWDQYRERQAHSNSLEYKSIKHGWTEEEFKAYNLSRSITPENMVTKYGLEEGLRRYEEYCEKQKITKSKDFVVSKYGLEAWNIICRKKAQVHDPVYVANKFNITLDEAVEKIMLKYKFHGHSQRELEFVSRIENMIGPLDHTSVKSPFGRWCAEGRCYFVYDIKHGNCIIEFNGDYWHANPRIYRDTDLIMGKSASSIWERDSLKLKNARDLGYNVMVIWENDYVNNSDKVVQEVVIWIQNTQK